VRGGSVIIPTGKDRLEAGDHILVFCTREDEEAVREFFQHGLVAEGGAAE